MADFVDGRHFHHQVDAACWHCALEQGQAVVAAIGAVEEVDPLFRRVLSAAKNELDPNWIMNPGLLIDKPAGAKIVG